MSTTSGDPPTTPIFGANFRENDHFWTFFGDFWLHMPILPFLRKFPLILTIATQNYLKRCIYGRILKFSIKHGRKLAKNSQKCQKIAIWRPKNCQIDLKKNLRPIEKIEKKIFFCPKKFFFDGVKKKFQADLGTFRPPNRDFLAFLAIVAIFHPFFIKTSEISPKIHLLRWLVVSAVIWSNSKSDFWRFSQILTFFQFLAIYANEKRHSRLS